MTTWLIASNNSGKSRDLSACLAYYGITARQYLTGHAKLAFPAETTTSYATNALTKAQFGAKQLGVPVIADDSGLEILARPTLFGVTTARDLGVSVSGYDRNQEILGALADLPDCQRQARMRATLAVAFPDGRQAVVQASIDGYIAHHQAGTYSGGFDRLFWLPRYGRTLAELPAQWRIPLTHRGQSAQQLVNQLIDLKGSVE